MRPAIASSTRSSRWLRRRPPDSAGWRSTRLRWSKPSARRWWAESQVATQQYSSWVLGNWGIETGGRAMRMVPALRITSEERRELERRAQGEHVSRRVAQRARIVLLAADGVPNRQIAMLVGLNQNQVGMWRKRYAAHGMAGLADRPRPGRPRRTAVAA